MNVVRNAISFDGCSREMLTASMQAITELENPNSVQQMKEWLANHGVEADALGKKAVSRDILCSAMKTLRHCFIVGRVHDELIIECDPHVDLKVVCDQMGRSPDWMPNILLRADEYETQWYRKD